METRLPPGTVSVRLVGLTEEAREALQGRVLAISSFPFRVGRETRQSLLPKGVEEAEEERRKDPGIPNNDLFIRESGRGVFLSREHFLIHHEKGNFLLVDRGSTLGTLVNGTLVGGEGRFEGVPLPDGAVIVPGGIKSPFRFRFEVGEAGKDES